MENMMSLLTCVSLSSRGQRVTLFRPLESHHSGHEIRTQLPALKLEAFWSVLRRSFSPKGRMIVNETLFSDFEIQNAVFFLKKTKQNSVHLYPGQ